MFAVDGEGGTAKWDDGGWWPNGVISHTENIKSLSASRTQQLDELVSEILVTPAASPTAAM